MRTPEGFMWNRMVPESWTRALATLTPKSELVPWLQLAWLSGDPWGPVQRWAVYEMVPLRLWWSLIQGHRQRGLTDEDIWEWHIIQALQGPHPRDIGYYDHVLDRFISEADCTRQEWELFHEHKAVPKIFWVIQGNKGGHKRFFSRKQQECLRLTGLPTDPPAPGSLPYAEFDTRVLDALAECDRLAKTKVADQENAVEARQKLVDWLTEQLHVELQAQPISLDGIPRTSDDPTGMIERRVNRFIETGSTKPQMED